MRHGTMAMSSEKPQSVHMIGIVNYSGGTQPVSGGHREICEDSCECPDSGVDSVLLVPHGWRVRRLLAILSSIGWSQNKELSTVSTALRCRSHVLL